MRLGKPPGAAHIDPQQPCNSSGNPDYPLLPFTSLFSFRYITMNIPHSLFLCVLFDHLLSIPLFFLFFLVIPTFSRSSSPFLYLLFTFLELQLSLSSLLYSLFLLTFSLIIRFLFSFFCFFLFLFIFFEPLLAESGSSESVCTHLCPVMFFQHMIENNVHVV